ncbi:MAG: ABC transporter substrate-binding protein [Chloroflexota bacterium]
MSCKPIDRRRALLLAGAALTMTACSRRQSAVSGEPQRTAVTIVNTAGTFAATLQQLMRDKGYLEKRGLRPTFLTVNDGSQIVGALISGEADICTASGFNQVFPAIAQGGDLKLLAGSELLLPFIVYTCRPEIRTLKDLEGHTIGTGAVGALLYAIMIALLRKNDVDPSKVKFVNIGSSGDVFRAVAAKVVDAGPVELDFAGEGASAGLHGLTDGKVWKDLPEYTNQASYTSERSIRMRREVLVRTLAAYAELYRFISSPGSRDAYIAARAAALGKNQSAEALTEWTFFNRHRSFAVDLGLSKERVRYIQALNVSMGVQKSILPYDKVTDVSLARSALALLKNA